MNACKNKNEGIRQLENTSTDSLAVINDPKNNLNIQMSTFSEIDSSGILIFPLSMGEGADRNSNNGSSYKSIPNNEYWNILFFNSATNEKKLLTERKVLILNYENRYLNYEQQIGFTKESIIYVVRSDDFNNDKLLNENDPQYLFISDTDGQDFKQISPSGFNLLNWKFINASNKFIMTLVKDSDGNKKFEEQDEICTFEYDAKKDSVCKEIFEISLKNKLKILFDNHWKKIQK